VREEPDKHHGSQLHANMAGLTFSEQRDAVGYHWLARAINIATSISLDNTLVPMPNEAIFPRPLGALAAFEEHRHLFHYMAAPPSHAWDAFYLATSWRTNGEIPEGIIEMVEALGAKIDGVNARKLQMPNATTTPLKRSSYAEIARRKNGEQPAKKTGEQPARRNGEQPAKDTTLHASVKPQPGPANARIPAIRETIADQWANWARKDPASANKSVKRPWAPPPKTQPAIPKASLPKATLPDPASAKSKNTQQQSVVQPLKTQPALPKAALPNPASTEVKNAQQPPAQSKKAQPAPKASTEDTSVQESPTTAKLDVANPVEFWKWPRLTDEEVSELPPEVRGLFKEGA
jgi:hypothetical protein